MELEWRKPFAVPRELPTGTVTFLFTDIEGSTRLLDSLGGERYHAVLSEHQRLLREAVKSAGGLEIDTQGDAFFFAFRKAKNALAAAIAGQRALTDFAWPEGVAVRVRMGLDTGEPTVGGDRYVGLGIHRTARIMAAAHGGQILLSATTHNLVRDEPLDHVTLRDLGEQPLKDLERPVRLYQVVAPDLRDKFPRLRTLDASLGKRLLRPRVGGPIALVLAAGAAAALLATGGGSAQTGPLKPQPLGHRLLAQIQVLSASCCAFTPDAVWAVGHHDDDLYKIDPRTNKVVKMFPVVGYQAENPLDAAGSLWIPAASSDLVRFDPEKEKVEAKIPVIGGDQIAWGYLDIWMTTRHHRLVRISTKTNKVVKQIKLAGGYNDYDDGLAIGYGSVWCTVTDKATLLRINPGTNRITATIRGFGNSESWMPITTAEGAVWVARITGDYEILYRIDPSTNKIVDRIKVGGRGATVPNGYITAGAGYVWTGNWGNTLSQVDARTDRVVAWYRIPDISEGLAYGFGSLWSGEYNLSAVARIKVDD